MFVTVISSLNILPFTLSSILTVNFSSDVLSPVGTGTDTTFSFPWLEIAFLDAQCVFCSISSVCDDASVTSTS